MVAPLPPIKGGIATHSLNVVSALLRQGHDVTAYSWSRQYPRTMYKREEREAGAEPDIPIRGSLHWANPMTWHRVGRCIGSQASLLVIPWVTPFHALQAVVLMLTARVPTVFIVHNARPHEWFPLTDYLSRWALSRATGLVAHSSGIVEQLRSIGVDVPAKVVPHPSNLDLRPMKTPSGDPDKLLFLGFVRPYKGLDLLIQALARLPEETTLTVAGEFWMEQEQIESLIRTLALEDRVEIMNRYVSEDELVELLTTRHIVVAPYRSGTQSGIVPLALSAGRPVVATEVGGLPEVIVDGVNGVLCSPDPASIAEAIRDAQNRYVELAKGSRTGAGSWSDVAKAIVGLVAAE